MTAFARGFLYWAHIDKRRPVLVVSHDARNRFANDVVVIPCSTNSRPLSWHVALGKLEGGLPQPSVLKCEQITTLRKSDLEPEALGATLSPQRMREIERAVRLALAMES